MIKTEYRTFRKKIGRPCRLFGKDFISISQAARHYAMNYKTVYHLVNKNLCADTDFEEYRNKRRNYSVTKEAA